MRELRAYLRLVRWEWVREVKRLDTIASMLFFGIIVLFVFSFAVDPDTIDPRNEDPRSMDEIRVLAGIIWIAILLAGAIGIDRAFRGVEEEKVLQGILLAPVSRITIYYAKITSTFLFVAIMEVVTLLLFCLLYNVDMPPPMLLRIVFIALSGSLGYVALGVTLSAMTRVVRGGDVLLRILLFPPMIPVFATLVDATKVALQGDSLTLEHAGIIGAFDIVFLMAGQILFDVIMADYDAN